MAEFWPIDAMNLFSAARAISIFRTTPTYDPPTRQYSFNQHFRDLNVPPPGTLWVSASVRDGPESILASNRYLLA